MNETDMYELQRLHDEHEANLEIEADLHGTNSQMYKDTYMLLQLTKKELENAVRRVVLYYDTDMKDADGLGWCVELQPSSTLHRFATFSDATMFITDNSWWFMPSIHGVKQ